MRVSKAALTGECIMPGPVLLLFIWTAAFGAKIDSTTLAGSDTFWIRLVRSQTGVGGTIGRVASHEVSRLSAIIAGVITLGS